jgi:hypothetical protein
MPRLTEAQKQTKKSFFTKLTTSEKRQLKTTEKMPRSANPQFQIAQYNHTCRTCKGHILPGENIAYVPKTVVRNAYRLCEVCCEAQYFPARSAREFLSQAEIDIMRVVSGICPMPKHWKFTHNNCMGQPWELMVTCNRSIAFCPEGISMLINGKVYTQSFSLWDSMDIRSYLEDMYITEDSEVYELV